MIPDIREKFNRRFTREKYQHFLDDLNQVFPGSIQFRIAETPVFVPRTLTVKILAAGEDIIRVIRQPDFKTLTRHAVPPSLMVPGENDHCQFIAIDFAICRDSGGELVPKLIELQGFPTLFAFQALIAAKYREHFEFPASLDNYFHGLQEDSYLSLLKRILLGSHEAAHVVLLEVLPHKQKTRVDFYCTESATGIRPLSITELLVEGRQLYYMRDGIRTRIKRIYNRIIFEDLEQQKKDLGPLVDLTADWDVEWIPHPNWFYKISKYTLPFIHSPYVPKTYFLNKMEIVPHDLENYVLKPLFSFAGQGVIIDLGRADIDAIKNPEGWILQQKVTYAEVIRTPDQPAKCEIRMIYFWEDPASAPQLVNNLARLSKGKMIGVRYNADHDWVGGSICFFEK
jgi:hypothetical protein